MVNGIGLKTAQRLILELKDKLSGGMAGDFQFGDTPAATASPVRAEACSALTMLGFAPAPTQKVVVQILQEQPALPVEQVVKLALKQIK